MSKMTERQKRVFIQPGQIQHATLKNYERARGAKTLEGEMYWWTRVFQKGRDNHDGTSTDISSYLVREMLKDERVYCHGEISQFVHSSNREVINEMYQIEKKEAQITIHCI